MKPVNDYISTQLDLDYAGNLSKQVNPLIIMGFMLGLTLKGFGLAALAIAITEDRNNVVSVFLVEWVTACFQYFWAPTLGLMVAGVVWVSLREFLQCFVAWRA